jgi:hypothetical protein
MEEATRIAWSNSVIEIDMSKYEQKPTPVELKEYEVWSEGYMATGESGGATLHGKVMARSFREACNILMCKHYLEWVTKMQDTNYTGQRDNPDSGMSYDPSHLTVWGCRLFDNEVDARKSFG